MKYDPSERWLEVEPRGEIAIVRFLQPQILDEEIISCIGEELIRLVEKEGCRRMVLDFQRVTALATHMLGELLVLHKKIKAAGGRVVLCELQPSLREIFEVLRLSQVFHVCGTAEEAVQSF